MLKRIISLILVLMVCLSLFAISASAVTLENSGYVNRTSEIRVVRTGDADGSIRVSTSDVNSFNGSLHAINPLFTSIYKDVIGTFSFDFEVTETATYNAAHTFKSRSSVFSLLGDDNSEYSFSIYEKLSTGARILLYESANTATGVTRDEEIGTDLNVAKTYSVEFVIKNSVTFLDPVTFSFTWRLRKTGDATVLSRDLIYVYEDKDYEYYQFQEPIARNAGFTYYQHSSGTNINNLYTIASNLHEYEFPKMGVYSLLLRNQGYSIIDSYGNPFDQPVIRLAHNYTDSGDMMPLSGGDILVKYNFGSIRQKGQKLYDASYKGEIYLESQSRQYTQYPSALNGGHLNIYGMELYVRRNKSTDINLLPPHTTNYFLENNLNVNNIVVVNQDNSITYYYPDGNGNLNQIDVSNEYNYHYTYNTYEIKNGDTNYIIQYTDNSVTYIVQEEHNTYYYIYYITNLPPGGSTDGVEDGNPPPEPPPTPTPTPTPGGGGEDGGDDGNGGNNNGSGAEKDGKGLLGTLWDTIKEVVAEALKALIRLIGLILNTLIEFITKVLSGVWNIVVGVIEGVVGKLGHFFDMFKDDAPTFDFFNGGDELWEYEGVERFAPDMPPDSDYEVPEIPIVTVEP